MVVKNFERPWKPSAHTQKALIKMFRPSKKYSARYTFPLKRIPPWEFVNKQRRQKHLLSPTYF